LFDPLAEFMQASLYRRRDLRPGARIRGPAVVIEDETSTVVSPTFDAVVNGFGYIEMIRKQ
jgi:N-methylhydantoinase A